MSVRRLLFAEVAPGRAFHAALARVDAQHPVAAHTHDFSECFLVIEGHGEHHVNGQSLPLQEGHLVLVRAQDTHAITSQRRLHIINIAFPEANWESDLKSIGLEAELRSWRQVLQPPCIPLFPGQLAAALPEFQRAIARFSTSGSFTQERLSLWRLYSTLVPLLLPQQETTKSTPELPHWLTRALATMREETNLCQGVPRFQQLCAVSPTHLARTVQAHFGQTPTELINELRLQRAVYLLNTSLLEIPEIAARCGFENLSYFYRVFKSRFGTTPRHFRLQASRAIAP